MEHVRVACLSTYKKMAHCLQTHGGGEYEKRLVSRFQICEVVSVNLISNYIAVITDFESCASD